MIRNDILEKARSIINGERAGTYGKAEDSFATIAQMWSDASKTEFGKMYSEAIAAMKKYANNEKE